jgi:hypothetical protein
MHVFGDFNVYRDRLENRTQFRTTNRREGDRIEGSGVSWAGCRATDVLICPGSRCLFATGGVDHKRFRPYRVQPREGVNACLEAGDGFPSPII